MSRLTPLPEGVAPLRTSTLLSILGDDRAGGSISFEELLSSFRQRAFGALLLVILLPTFIPVPIGIGAITGPMIALLGAQMLLTFSRPWLPGWVRRRRMERATVARFGARFRPLLSRLERICRPRLTQITERVWAHAFTGLQLVILGLLLALPIPFTNYPYGIVLLLYAVALIERDGVLLLIAWTLGIGAIVASVMLSGEVVALIGRMLG
ncbi:exopolysaccharide biosynthesis protein [Chiayiivirga flava]|uniref:Exopolysaccharide biosynthesis protein n=1 Tax=Chiayiivirga flava TaxID=659595 RepID=A0A7W8D2V4_9GAMM|nr:exopolysaccharide biosynthesis protein [Chiayiivirga flava]MBB5206834.1 hypothetical protein [Chiayiivirga flava]